MDDRPLGTSGLSVSRLALGTMTYGAQNTRAEAFAQLDYARDQGINFIDTAEMYPSPPREEWQGTTESIIGSWLTKRKTRAKIILAGKVAGPGIMPYIRDGKVRLDRRNIDAAIEASLKRLRTDYIDLYQVHWPDRDTNFFGRLGYTGEATTDGSVPIEETLGALARHVEKGTIRHIGVSNETPWGLGQYLKASERKDLPRIQSIQNPYHLLNRSFEVGLAEISVREQIGLLAYSPLAMGYLTGKYLGGAKPAGARHSLYDFYARYNTPRRDPAVAAYVDFARDHGLDPAQMALAFVLSRPFVTAAIIGATNLQQLQSNIAARDIILNDDIMTGLQEIYLLHQDPCP